MAMTWNTLTAAKGQPGAVMTWCNYSLLDTNTVVDEAQSLLYSEARLRCREMMTDMVFTMSQFSSYQPLPANFLDPIGDIFVSTFNDPINHRDSGTLQASRTFTENSGTLGNNPLTTASASTSVSVNLPSHNLTQDSIFNTSGATAFNGVTIAGTFPVSSITDTNNFVIDITSLGVTPNAAGAGGGNAVAYIADSLNFGSPRFYAIYNERINFDQSFFQTSLCRLQFYQSLPLLSGTNTTNFLTNRYPKLLRIACMCSAAEFMKDPDEYARWYQRLTSAVASVSAENDMQFRGMDLVPETP